MDYTYCSDALQYDPFTGLLFWKKRPISHFTCSRIMNSFNTRLAGKMAGHLRKDGYIHIILAGQPRRAHRLAWLLHYKVWPKSLIDHINRNSSDNRICNLREATASLNMLNRKLFCNSTSGFRGVCWDNKQNKWRARLQINNERKFIGYFATKELAYAAYIEEAKKLGAINEIYSDLC